MRHPLCRQVPPAYFLAAKAFCSNLVKSGLACFEVRTVSLPQLQAYPG
jgi:hypothetical protein